MSESAGGDASGGGGGEWTTIESDPGVFTEMLEKLGCSCAELEELYSLDDDSLKALQDSTGAVYGLIFLFKWMGNAPSNQGGGSNSSREPIPEDSISSNLFFAHQVTTNACATQAILSVLFNAGMGRDELGTVLSDFQSFTASFPPSLKGVAISSSDEIKTAHNSFARQDAFMHEGKVHIPTDEDEAFHFVAYVPVDGTVYELDGLQKGPIVVGTYGSDKNKAKEEAEDGAAADGSSEDGGAAAAAETPATTSADDWLAVARTAVQDRMAAGGDGAGGHIKFNLMAVIQDKRIKLRNALDGDDSGAASAQLAVEDAKRERWRLENQRRRHNYVPLCIQLFKELARKGSLNKLVMEAKERRTAKRQKK